MEAGANHSRWRTALIATLAWIGLGLQFYITLGQSMAMGKTVGSAIAFYLSFFTILTNFLVPSAHDLLDPRLRFKAGTVLQSACGSYGHRYLYIRCRRSLFTGVAQTLAADGVTESC